LARQARRIFSSRWFLSAGLWPGCETVEGIAVLMDGRGKFTVHIVEYGSSKKKNADRALRCIQREKARRFHLKIE
jgi:hypothetical protein